MIRVLLSFVLFLAVAMPASAAKRVALVIGNAQYEHVPRLEAPPKDVRLLVDTLRSIAFDDVQLLEDLDGQALRNALRDFSEKSTNAEIAMIYFSGHGIELDRKNYLVPVDARLRKAKDADFEAIDVDHFRRAVDGATKLRMVVLDACRNNPFPVEAKDGSRSLRSRGLAEVQPGVNELVAFSAQAGVVADDSASDGFSPFVSSFVKHIATPGLDIRFVMGKVRDDVLKNTGPTDDRDGPQIPYVESSLGGEQIVFKAGEAPDAPTPPAQDRNADAKAAFDAAGSDVNMLKTVAEEFADTTWGKLAAGRVKTAVESKQVVMLVPDGETPARKVIQLKADGTGDYKTIAEAVGAVDAGTRIELEPGDYRADFNVDTPLEIVGRGTSGQVKIISRNGIGIRWTAPSGLIENVVILTDLPLTPGAGPALTFDNGSAKVVGNFISATSSAAILVTGKNSNPEIVENWLTSSKYGIQLTLRSRAVIQANEISRNGQNHEDGGGVLVEHEADPVLVGNKIIHNMTGVIVGTKGLGTFDNNQISNNARMGVNIGPGGVAIFTKNRIKENRNKGVFVDSNASGTFIGNDLRENGEGAWRVWTGAGKVNKSENLE